MPCYYPVKASRRPNGTIAFGKDFADSGALRLPCGNCIGCRMAHAKAWALRCRLELQQHTSAVFTTLTYRDDALPLTLSKRHLSLFLKRLRTNLTRSGTNRTLRFFASGEYGEKTHRPHYHAILFGMALADAAAIETAWGLGFAQTKPITTARINYCAGYTAKKAGWKDRAKREHVDPETGEVYQWQPPFLQMSRNPGIAAHARQWPQSWRAYAIDQHGHFTSVPRYLHNSWRNQATPQQLTELQHERFQLTLSRKTETPQQREAAATIAMKKYDNLAQRRAV